MGLYRSKRYYVLVLQQSARMKDISFGNCQFQSFTSAQEKSSNEFRMFLSEKEQVKSFVSDYLLHQLISSYTFILIPLQHMKPTV